MIGINGLSLSGERRRLTRAAFVALNKFGTDAHVWIPGIGYFNGLQAGNYIDSAGTQAGLVDNPVGLVMDAEGSLGAELVTNGGFDSATGWTAGTGWTISGGVAAFSATGSFSELTQSLSIADAKVYRVVLNATVSAGTVTVQVGGPGATTYLIAATGLVSVYLVANGTGTNSNVRIIAGTTFTGTIDNISVREVTGAITATQGTTANKPILRRGAVNLFPYGQTTSGAPSSRSAWIISQGYGGTGTPTTFSGSSAVDLSGIGYWEFTVNTTAVSTNRLLVDWGAINGAASTRQPVIASTAYTASMYVSVNGFVTSSNNYVKPQILWYTSGNVFISSSDGGQVSAPSTFGSLRLSITATAPATAAFAQIRIDFSEGLVIGSTANATVRVGGAQLELGSTASEYIPTTTAAKSSSSGNYWWQFDGSNDSLALSAVPFQMADDHCVVVACNVTSFSVLRQLWFNGGASGAGRCASFFVSSGGQPAWIWRDDASVVTTQLTLSAQSANNAFVSSATKKGSTVTARLNASGPQSGSVAGIGATTVNAAFLGSLQGSGNWHLGSIYPVIAIKGTVTDADLLTLERWVGSLSGVSI